MRYLRFEKPLADAAKSLVLGQHVTFGVSGGAGIVKRIYYRPGEGVVYVDLYALGQTNVGEYSFVATAVVFVGATETGILPGDKPFGS